MKITTLDLETSGLPFKNVDYKKDYMDYPYIVSLAYKINDKPRREFIINQEGIVIPEEAIKIHGITDEISSLSPYNILDVIGQVIFDCSGSDYIIGFNLFFDSSIFKANILRLIKQERTNQNIYNIVEDILHKDKRIDVMRVCHKLFGGKWPTLSEAYKKLFNEDFNAHSAGDDVDATHRIYVELLKRGLVPPEPRPVVLVEEE